MAVNVPFSQGTLHGSLTSLKLGIKGDSDYRRLFRLITIFGTITKIVSMIRIISPDNPSITY